MKHPAIVACRLSAVARTQNSTATRSPSITGVPDPNRHIPLFLCLLAKVCIEGSPANDRFLRRVRNVQNVLAEQIDERGDIPTLPRPTVCTNECSRAARLTSIAPSRFPGWPRL